jgi:hypothetical protein
MDALIPEIDHNVPLPASAREAYPDLSPKEELEMRARTIKMLADLSGSPLDPTEENRDAAVQIATDMVKGGRPDYAIYPNETVAYLAGLVAQYDTQVVRELADLKRFVVNKLVEETGHPDAKIRIAAIKALGEVDGVDAFKKRTEVTVKQQSIEEVEKELLATLAKLEGNTVDVKMVEIVEKDDSTDA